MPFPTWDEFFWSKIDEGMSLFEINRLKPTYWAELNKDPEFAAQPQEYKEDYRRKLYDGLSEEQLPDAEKLMDNYHFNLAYSTKTIKDWAQATGKKEEEQPGYFHTRTRFEPNPALKPYDFAQVKGANPDDPGIYFVKPDEPFPEDGADYVDWKINEKGEVVPARGNPSAAQVNWARNEVEVPFMQFGVAGKTPDFLEPGESKAKYALGKINWPSISAALQKGVAGTLETLGGAFSAPSEEERRWTEENPEEAMRARMSSWTGEEAKTPTFPAPSNIFTEAAGLMGERAAQSARQAQAEAMLRPDQFLQPDQPRTASDYGAAAIENAPLTGSMLLPGLLGLGISAITKNPTWARAGALAGGGIGAMVSAGETAEAIRQSGKNVRQAEAARLAENFAAQVLIEYGATAFQFKSILKGVGKPGAALSLVDDLTKVKGVERAALLSQNADVFARVAPRVSRLEQRISMITNMPLKRATQLGYGAMSFLAAAGSEGIEEVLQKASDTLAVSGDWGDVSEALSKNPQEWVDEFVVGAVMGLGIGGAGNVVAHGSSLAKSMADKRPGSLGGWMDETFTGKSDSVKLGSIAASLAGMGASRQEIANAIGHYQSGDIEKFNQSVDQIDQRLMKLWETAKPGEVPQELRDNFVQNQLDKVNGEGVWSDFDPVSHVATMAHFVVRQSRASGGKMTMSQVQQAVAPAIQGPVLQGAPEGQRAEVSQNIGAAPSPELMEEVYGRPLREGAASQDAARVGGLLPFFEAGDAYRSKLSKFVERQKAGDNRWYVTKKNENGELVEVPVEGAASLVAAIAEMDRSVDVGSLVRTLFPKASISKTKRGWEIKHRGGHTVVIEGVRNPNEMRYQAEDANGNLIIVDPVTRQVAPYDSAMQEAVLSGAQVVAEGTPLPARKKAADDDGITVGTRTRYRNGINATDIIQFLVRNDAGVTVGHEGGHIVAMAIEFLPKEIQDAIKKTWGIDKDTGWVTDPQTGQRKYVGDERVEAFVEDIGRYGSAMNGQYDISEFLTPAAGKRTGSRARLYKAGAYKGDLIASVRGWLAGLAATAVSQQSGIQPVDVLEYLTSGGATNAISQHVSRPRPAAKAQVTQEAQAVREQPEAAAQAQPAGEGAGRGVERGVEGVQERRNRAAHQQALPVGTQEKLKALPAPSALHGEVLAPLKNIKIIKRKRTKGVSDQSIVKLGDRKFLVSTAFSPDDTGLSETMIFAVNPDGYTDYRNIWGGTGTTHQEALEYLNQADPNRLYPYDSMLPAEAAEEEGEVIDVEAVQARVSRRQDARPVDFSTGAEIEGIPYRGQTSTMIMYMRPDQYLKLADRYEGPDVADARESLKNGAPLPIPALSVRMSGEVRPGAETLEVTGSKGQAIARVAQIQKAGRIPVSVEMEGGWSDSEVSMAAAGLPLTRSRESGRAKVDPEERFLGDRPVEQMKAPKPTMGAAAREPVAEPGPTTKKLNLFERRTTREHRLVRRPMQEYRMVKYDPATKRWRWLPLPPAGEKIEGPAPRLLRSEIQSELQRAREAHTAAVTRKDPLEAIKQSKLIAKLELELSNRTAPKGLDVTGLSEQAAWRKQADQLEERSRNSTDAAEAAKMLTQSEKLRKMADEKDKKDFEERDRVLKNVGLTRDERRKVSVLMEKLFFGDIGTARYKAALKGFRSAAAKSEAVLGTFRAQYPHMGPQIDGVLAALKDRQPGLFSTRANRLNGSLTADDRIIAKQREAVQSALADMNAALRLLDAEYRQNQAGILQASRKEFRPKLQRQTHPATKSERRILNALDDSVTETLGSMQAYTDAARRDSDEQDRVEMSATRELQVPSFAHVAVSRAERLARQREEAALAEDRLLNPNDQEPDIESMEDDELAELLGVDEKELEAGRAAFEADQNPEEGVQKRDKYGPETTDLWDPETGMSSDSVHRKIMQLRAEKNAARLQRVRDMADQITQSPEEMFASETDPAKKAKAVAREYKRRKALSILGKRLMDIEAGKSRKITVLDAATYLDAWWAQRNRNTGGQPGDWKSPKARERAIRLAVKELQWHMQNRGRAGEFWYSRSVDRAIDSIMGRYPELADVTQRGMFKLILAVASATTDVAINWKNAQTAWDAFSTTGTVPNTVRGITDEERVSSAVKQIERLNKLLAYFREVNGGTLNETAERQLLTFLTTPMSRADILTVVKAAGIYEVSEDEKKTKNYPKTDHSREDGLGYAATMFGNKVGPFFLNMNGITEIPTVDRWMLRAIGRLFGMTVQGRVNGYTGLEMEDAISAPPQKQEDQFMQFAQGFIREVAKKLNMSADDVQAMWWYYEKDLWDALTRTHSSRLRDYEQAAEKTNRIIPQQASLFAEEEMGDAYREGAKVRRAEAKAAQDRADAVGDETVEADRGALGGRQAAESEQLSKEAAKRDVSPEEYAAEVTDLGSEEAVNQKKRVRDWVKDIVPADQRSDFDAALAVDMLTSLAASAQKVFRNDGIDIYKHGSLARLIGFTHPRLSARMKTALSAVGLTPIAGRHIKNYVPLVQMLRHPLSELATVFFVDNSGRIVDTFVTSARIPGGAPMPLFNQRNVIEAIMDASGATGFFMVHNHPSGDVLPSTGDKSVSFDLSMMKGYMGHLITDATQVYLMKPGEKDQILDVPADWQTKFPTQQQYVARFAERLGYHPPADLNDTMDELQLPKTISKLMNRHQDLKHQSAAWLIFPDSRGRISMYKPIHPNEMNAEAMKAHIDRVMAKLPVYNPFLIFNSASALMRNHDLIAELSQQGHIQRAAAVDSRGRDGYYSVSDAKEAASELRYQAERAVYAPGVRVKSPAFQRLSARLGAAQTREQNLADAVKNLADVEVRVTTPDARLVAEETERANRVVNRVAEKLGIPRGTDQELDAVAEILNRAFGEEGVQERTTRDKTSPEYKADLAEATRLQIESIELEKNNRRSPEDAAKYRANQAKLAEYLFTRQVDMADVLNSPEYLAALNKAYNEVAPDETVTKPNQEQAVKDWHADPVDYIFHGEYAIISADTATAQPGTPEFAEAHKRLGEAIDATGAYKEEMEGKYKMDDGSSYGATPTWFVIGLPRRNRTNQTGAYYIGKQFGQESILWMDGDQPRLLYTNGALDGQYRLLSKNEGAFYGDDAKKQDYYTAYTDKDGVDHAFSFGWTETMQAADMTAEAPNTPAGTDEEGVQTRKRMRSLDMDRSSFERLPYVDKAPGLKMHDGYIWVEDTSVNRPGTVRMVRAYVPTWGGKVYDLESNEIGTIVGWKPAEPVRVEAVNERQVYRGAGPTVPSDQRAAGYGMRMQRPDLDLGALGSSLVRALTNEGSEAEEAARRTGRTFIGEHARKRRRTEELLHKAMDYMADKSEAENMAMIKAMEDGRIGDIADEKTRAIAKILREELDRRRDEIRALHPGLLETYMDNYFPHIWEMMRNELRMPGKKPVAAPPKGLKHRTVESYEKGMQAGLRPASYNAVELALVQIMDMDRFIKGHQWLYAMQNLGHAVMLPASQAHTAPVGWVQVEYEFGRFLKLNPNYVLGGKEPKYLTSHVMYMNPDAAEVFRRHYDPSKLRNSEWWKFYRNLGNALNQLQLGFSAFHLMFTSIDAASSVMSLAYLQLYHNKGLKKLQALGTGARAFVAPLTNALTGAIVRSDYEGTNRTGARVARFLRDQMPGNIFSLPSEAEAARISKMIERAGGTVGEDPWYFTGGWEQARDAWRQLSRGQLTARDAFYGLTGALWAIPEAVSKPIMSWIVPMQKLGVAYDLMRFELDRLGPNADPAEVDEAMQRAWDSVDNRMGQLVYDNLFWNNTMKELSFGLVRAVGWNLGTLRELGGGTLDLLRNVYNPLFGRERPGFTPRMSYALGMSTFVGVLGLITTCLYGGWEDKDHPEETFGQMLKRKGEEYAKNIAEVGVFAWNDLFLDAFFPRTNEVDAEGNPLRKAYASYMKDVVAWYNDPKQTALHKLHPLLHLIGEQLQNRDFNGFRLADPSDPGWVQAKDRVAAFLRGFQPFSMRNMEFINLKLGGEASPFDQIASYVGILPAPAWTGKSEAARYLAEVAYEQTWTQARRDEPVNKKKRLLAAKLRHGTPIKKEDYEGLTGEQVSNILRKTSQPDIINKLKSGGVDPWEAMEAWRRMNKRERLLSAPIILQKIANKYEATADPDQRAQLLKLYQELTQRKGAK